MTSVSSSKSTKSNSNRLMRLRRTFLQVLIGAAVSAVVSSHSIAQTFNSNSGTASWNVSGNWTPAGFPNGVGTSATFNSVTAASTVNLGAAITVGSINFTNNSSTAGHVRTLANGTGGSLILDATGAGEATITVSGTSTLTNNVTISAATTLNDTLRFTNNNVSGTGAATATMTGTVSGSGGFIKDGAGRFSFTTAAKTYTGATTVNQGRLRYTATGASTGTSAITVNSGGSLYLDSNNGNFSFGSAGITINGDGVAETGGQGALRNQNSGTTTLNNGVTLGSNATIHVDGGGGTLILASGLAGSTATTLTKTGGGTLSLTTANASLNSGMVVTNGGITTSAASRIGDGSLALAQTAGNNTTITLNNASQAIGNLSTSWTDTTGTLSQRLILNGTALTINQASDTTFGNGSINTLTGTISGTGSITKSGVGTLTLGGTNTYTGTTTIDGGTLEVNGSITNSAVTIATGGTLSGSGSVTGTVSVEGGGTLAGTGTYGATNIAATGILSPGNSPGAVTFTNGLTLNSDSVFEWDLFSNVDSLDGGLGGTDFDFVAVTGGALTIQPGATAKLISGGTFAADSYWDSNREWNVFSFTGTAPTSLFNTDLGSSLVTALSGRGSFSWSTSGSNVVLNYTAVPEPTSMVFGLGLSVAGIVAYRRRQSKKVAAPAAAE